MKLYRKRNGRHVAPAAVDMQHGEPLQKVIGIGPRKRKKLTKRQAPYAEPLGGVGGHKGGTRMQIARKRFQLVESGKLCASAAAGLERDYAREFARFRAEARPASAAVRPPDPPFGPFVVPASAGPVAVQPIP